MDTDTFTGRSLLADMRPASMVPEADGWRQALKEQRAAQEEFERNRRDADADKDAKVEAWRKIAQQSEQAREIAEKQMRDHEAEAEIRVKEIQLVSFQQAEDCEQRVRVLEGFLDDERRASAEEAQQHAHMVRRVQEEAEDRVQDAERRSDAAIAAAEERVREADSRAAAALRRADEEIAQARLAAEARVQEIRERAELQLRECKAESYSQLEQMHWTVIQRQRAMEEGLFPNGRPSSEVLMEVRGQGAAIEQGMKELRMAREVEAAQTGRGPINKAQHEDAMLELEKTLHARTLERSMHRATPHLVS